MERSLENPFREDHKPRKPGVAGLVGDMYGEKAKAAYVKRVSEGKKRHSAPQENWEGADITMSAAEKAGMDIERNHVRLQNIPTFSKLPSEEVIKEDFNFGSIWQNEYRQDRPVTDFILGGADLADVGLYGQAAERILEAMSRVKEPRPFAKVFDIADVIRQKQQAHPKHPNNLSTREVFEAIDAAGYRPATLQELLAYGRDYWKPDVDLDTLSEEEERRLQLANAPHVYVLGSPFSVSGRHRFVSGLVWRRSAGRRLDARILENVYNSDIRFLVVLKTG